MSSPTHPNATGDTAATNPHDADQPDEKNDGVADVAERLMVEFGDRVDLPTISQVVLGCRRDLQGAPVNALPELIERLARQRLLTDHPGPGRSTS